MLEFSCEKCERVKVNKVYDYIIKNSNLNQRQINNFSEIISQNLGLESSGMDEVSIEEFDEEFLNYFKNNKSIIEAWKIVKEELQKNICELWV